MTEQLCDLIYGKMNMWNINAGTFHERPRGFKEYKWEIFLKKSIRNRKINQKQANWIISVWNKTIRNNTSNWSVNIADSIEKYTKNSLKPIVAEKKQLGVKGFTKNSLSGCLYYNCKTEEEIEYLTNVIYHCTTLFTTYFKKNNNIKLLPLDFNDPNEKKVLKAIVYGLFTRPRMCSSIKTDIIDGAITENSPRCICESNLIQLKLNLEQKKRQIIQNIHLKKNIFITNFMNNLIFRNFIQKYRDMNDKNIILNSMEGNMNDDWETIWKDHE